MKQRISFCTTSDGVRIAYATAGHGPPLIRAGGWMTHIEHDWDSPVWRHWLRELTRDHTLVRFDIRGSGLSDHDVVEQGVEAWTRDLDAVVEALGYKRFSLLGLCQGGAIAVVYAARHPERVDHLLLYNAYAQGAFTDDVPQHKADEAEALASMIRVGWGRKSGAFREVFARLMSPRGADDQVNWWADLQRLTANPENAARLWRCFHQLDVRDLLKNVKAPTLVAHVEGDHMVPFELGRTLAGRINGASFLPLSGNNHILQPSDTGWRTFVQALRAFLADEPEGSGAPPAEFESLTGREAMILEIVARGLSNADIAEAMSIAPKTVRNHVSNICGKLSVDSRAQLIVQAREAGFGVERRSSYLSGH